ncbi:hypothetical protein N0V92_001648 [Colletotrichum tropicale]|nr:hypothetical protein N0V92_001648 [Colletotrichum tropicale]
MNLFTIFITLTAIFTTPSTPRSSLTYQAYLFVYFVRNSIGGENISLAASSPDDILTFTPLTASAPILASSKGTLGLRDPFITRAPTGDKFFLLATDLSIGRGMSFTDAQRVGSRHIEVWESPDLVHWSEQRHVLVAPPEAGNAWAPETYFDEGLGMWFVFWASSLYDEDDVEHTGRSYNRVMYATTRDFVEFSEARVWQDAGGSRMLFSATKTFFTDEANNDLNTRIPTRTQVLCPPTQSSASTRKTLNNEIHRTAAR